MTTNSSADEVSPTLALDVAMKEIDQNGHDDERMVLVFNAFDQIIPQLGVFTPLATRLRNEFFDFTYSSKYTVEQIQKASKKRKRVACVERLSYKVLCERLLDENQDLINMYESRMADMEASLAGKNRDLNQTFEKIQQMDIAKQKLMDELSALRATLEERDKDIENLKEDCDRIRYNCDQEVFNTRLKVQDIIDNQEATEALIADLSRYKQGYDEMQEAFVNSPSERPSTKKDSENQEEPYIQVKKQLMLDIQVATRLEEQMVTLLNMTTEEYDQRVDDEHKKLLKNENDLSESQFIKDNIDTEQIRYIGSIKEIREELTMMQRHRRTLEEKLEMVIVKGNEKVRNRKANVAFAANEAAQKAGKSTNLLQGLERAFESAERKTDHIEYGPQERVLSRFACVIASSTNGLLWTDFNSATYCESCADNTYLCPHKFPESQTIVRVPDGTKYVRISRPPLKYNEALIRKVMNDNKKLITQMLPPIYQQNDASILRTNYPGHFNSNETSRKPEVASEITPLQIQTFDRVWEDYKKRTSLVRPIPRPYSTDRLFNMIIEILAYECYCDTHLINVTGNIVDDIYEIFTKRYTEIDQVPYASVHDFLTSLYASRNSFKTLELFMHVLIGNIDVTCMYYVALLGEILEKLDWNETDDARIFFSNIYPFLDDDGLDTVIIDYVSFTENTISRFLIMEYIISMLLKGNEPLFQEMQYKLSVQVSENFNMMTIVEFQTAIENIAYTSDERLVSRVFNRAERHSQWNNIKGSVLMTKLAHIASYLYFIQFLEEQKEPFDEKVQKEINLHKKSEEEYKSRTRKQVVDEQRTLLKYAQIKSLGNILYETDNVSLSDDSKDFTASKSFINENTSST
ncbi:unnamed protein product [Adineta ricciae]|uniref:Uncharacterized protein n=1 Tax=Adineta ricciae TaxID=249248 RepID=A0A814I2D2_ADIRI|nr:unnamed protein product [Adineta ricciae]